MGSNFNFIFHSFCRFICCGYDTALDIRKKNHVQKRMNAEMYFVAAVDLQQSLSRSKLEAWVKTCFRISCNILKEHTHDLFKKFIAKFVSAKVTLLGRNEV